MTWRGVILAGLVALAFAGETRAAEDYHLLVFGSQRIPNDPDYSHTFATFVRRRWPGNGPCPANSCVEGYTISWLPRTMNVRVLALPECGQNFDLHNTIRWALGNNMRISLWGPYPVHPDLYCRAAKQVGLLQSGQVMYKALDTGY